MTSATSTPPYRGRFAPTPSGPLHLGSLLTALASYLEARQAGGRWLLRIDDLDTPRCPPGAADTIRRQMEAYGLLWDEREYLQSEHLDAYRDAVSRCCATLGCFHCQCTRARLKQESLPGLDEPVYAGTCRTLGAQAGGALRVRAGTGSLGFHDSLQGWQQRDRSSQLGDFVIQRADGIYGYPLACAVDEHAMGITHVVRGADLLGASFRQILLMQALGTCPPQYLHLPVLCGPDGRKLSKQNHAPALDPQSASRQIFTCLRLLGQQPPDALLDAPPALLLDWSCAHWQRAALPQQSRLSLTQAQ